MGSWMSPTGQWLTYGKDLHHLETLETCSSHQQYPSALLLQLTPPTRVLVQQPPEKSVKSVKQEKCVLPPKKLSACHSSPEMLSSTSQQPMHTWLCNTAGFLPACSSNLRPELRGSICRRSGEK